MVICAGKEQKYRCVIFARPKYVTIRDRILLLVKSVLDELKSNKTQNF